MHHHMTEMLDDALGVLPKFDLEFGALEASSPICNIYPSQLGIRKPIGQSVDNKLNQLGRC